MKYRNIARTGLLALSLVLALAACDKQEDRLVVTPKTASTLRLSAESVTIDRTKPDDEALKLTWSAADLGHPQILASYDLLISRPQAKQAKPDTLVIGIGPKILSKAFKHLELNQILVEKLKLQAGVPEQIHLQIRAQPYSTAPTPIVAVATNLSSAVALTVVPADIRLKSLDYFFVGSMFGDEHKWKKDYAGYPFFLDAPDAKVYTYTGKFAAGAEFKIDHELNLGIWDRALATSAPGKLELGKGDNIKDAAAGGYFTVSFDPEALTYTVEPFAGAEGATVYKSMGLIGTSVGGWEHDVDLTQASYDPHIWKAERIEIAAGELKIRADDDWAKSWGGTSFPVAKSDSGDNIKISADMAGAYFVVFNDLTGHYHFRKLAE